MRSDFSLKKTILAEELSVFPGSPMNIETAHVSKIYHELFIIIGQWSESSFKPWKFGSQQTTT